MLRKPRRLAAASSHLARWAGWRQETGAWSSWAGRPGRQARAPQLERRRPGRLGQRRHGRLGHLDPAGGLLVGRGDTGHGDGRLLGRDRGAGGQDDLRETGAVADDQEGDRCQLAAAMDPALEQDLGSRGGVRQVGCECACHASSSRGKALEVWAGARSRCHHTFAGPGVLLTGLSLYVVRTGHRCAPGSEGVRQAPRSPGPGYDGARREIRIRIDPSDVTRSGGGRVDLDAEEPGDGGAGQGRAAGGRAPDATAQESQERCRLIDRVEVEVDQHVDARARTPASCTDPSVRTCLRAH